MEHSDQGVAEIRALPVRFLVIRRIYFPAFRLPLSFPIIISSGVWTFFIPSTIIHIFFLDFLCRSFFFLCFFAFTALVA